jgi:hypothetical protein
MRSMASRRMKPYPGRHCEEPSDEAIHASIAVAGMSEATSGVFKFSLNPAYRCAHAGYLPAESVENEPKADVFENAEVANSRRTRVCTMCRVVV